MSMELDKEVRDFFTKDENVVEKRQQLYVSIIVSD